MRQTSMTKSGVCTLFFTFLRLRLGVYKGIEYNDHKGMKRKGMECI